MAFTLGAITLCNHDFHDVEVVSAIAGITREGRFFAVRGTMRISDQPKGQLIVIENVQVRNFTTKPLLQAALMALLDYIGKVTTRNRTLSITTSIAGTNTYSNVTLEQVYPQMSPIQYWDAQAGGLRWKSLVTFEFVRHVNI